MLSYQLWNSKLSLFILFIAALSYDVLSSNAAPVPATSMIAERASNVSDARLPSLPDITMKHILLEMLDKLGNDTADRWVTAAPISTTRIGTEDSSGSNKDIIEAINHVILGPIGKAKPGDTLWTDVYFKVLALPDKKHPQSLECEFAIIDEYANATLAYSNIEAKLVNAYGDANDKEVTLIGASIPGMKKVDALSLAKMEDWAEKNVPVEGFSEKDYRNYLQRKKILGKLEPQYQELDMKIQMSSQASLYKRIVDSQMFFNVSMLIGGEKGTDLARYGPAWSATAINQSGLNRSDVTEIQDNLKGDLGDPSSGPYQSSVNSEAPKSTSSSSTADEETSKSPSPTSSTSSSAEKTKRTPSTIPTETSFPTWNRGFSTSRTVASSHYGRHSLQQRYLNSTRLASNTPVRRELSILQAITDDAASHRKEQGSESTRGLNILQVVTEGADQVDSKDPPNPGYSGSGVSQKAADQDDDDDGADTKTETTSTKSPDDNSTDVTTVQVSGSLAGEIVILSLQAGAWSNQMSKYIEFLFDQYPAIAEEYFGKLDGKGSGPIGRYWTHIVLLTTLKPNSKEIQTVQLLGMIYDIIPILKTLRPKKTAEPVSGSDKP